MVDPQALNAAQINSSKVSGDAYGRFSLTLIFGKNKM